MGRRDGRWVSEEHRRQSVLLLGWFQSVTDTGVDLELLGVSDLGSLVGDYLRVSRQPFEVFC